MDTISTKGQFEAIKNDSVKTYNLESDIDCGGGNIKSVSFQGTFDGQNKTIMNCIVTQWTDAKDIDNNSIKVMGLFAYSANSTIKNLNLTNIQFNLGYTNEYIWAGNLSLPHFVGQVLGYGKNITFNNIKINVQPNNNMSASFDYILPLNNTFRPFIGNDDEKLKTQWCLVKQSYFNSSTNINMFTGILGGYYEQNVTRINIYAVGSIDFTFYDRNINGEYCRYKDTQTSQDSSMMFGAQISE